jgi:integrase
MVNANQYLKRRTGRNRSGERWYLQVPVPKELRPRLGRTVERCLRTDSVRLARARRDALLPEIHALFARARAEPTLAEAVAAARLEAHIQAAEAAIDGRPALTPAEPRTEAIVPQGVEIPPEAGSRAGAMSACRARLSEARLAGLYAEWERERRPAGRTKLDFRRALRRLEEHVGHDDAARLTRGDIAAFRDAMLRDTNWKTTFNALAAVRAVLNVGVRTGALAANPAAGVVVKKVAGERRLPFDDAEAAMVLAAARHERGARRWVPWLLAYTGARLEEVCQARVQDIREDAGIAYLDITPAAGPLKNAGSARKVPLHPALIAEGFLDYVRALRPGALFPDLKPDRFGRRGGTATKVLGRALRSLGIIDRRKVAGHSWRHRFKDQCRAAGVEKAIHDALTGHTSRDVGDGYGLGYPLPVLAAAIKKLLAV